MSFQKIQQAYRSVAVYFLNTVLMAAVAGGIYFLVTRLRSTEPPDDPIKRYGTAQLMPGFCQSEVRGEAVAWGGNSDWRFKVSEGLSGNMKYEL